MTSALDAKELSENVVEAVAAMKTDKVGDISLYSLLDDDKAGLLQVDMKKIKSAAPLMGNSYLCPVATSHLSVEIQGIDNGSEKSYKISQYKGR